LAGAPQKVDSVVLNDGAAQRSMVNQLTVTFDGAAIRDPGASELRGQDGSLVDFHRAVSGDGGGTGAVLSCTVREVIGAARAAGTATWTAWTTANSTAASASFEKVKPSVGRIEKFERPSYINPSRTGKSWRWGQAATRSEGTALVSTWPWCAITRTGPWTTFGSGGNRLLRPDRRRPFPGAPGRWQDRGERLGQPVHQRHRREKDGRAPLQRRRE